MAEKTLKPTDLEVIKTDLRDQRLTLWVDNGRWYGEVEFKDRPGVLGASSPNLKDLLKTLDFKI